MFVGLGAGGSAGLAAGGRGVSGSSDLCVGGGVVWLPVLVWV